jgi:hypothetical protein
MTDKTTSEPVNQEMDRGELIRTHFEVQRDLHWAATLEPRLGEYNLSPDAMRHYREAWNVFAEDRDWSWWKEEARHYSNDELKAEIAECLEELEAIETRQPARERAEDTRQRLQGILSGQTVQAGSEPANTRTRTQER